MKKKPLTAKSFASQLKADQAYQAKLDQQASMMAQTQRAENALMNALSARGHDAASLDELVRKNAPLSRDLADALIESLEQVSDPNVREAVVRVLGATREEFNVAPLVTLFEESDSATLRWAIASTLAEARPRRLGDWLLRAVQDSRYGKAREMLAVAAARTNPPEVVNPLLVRLLDDLPGHAALALAETGSSRELDALRRAHRTTTGWEREQVGRTINLIERREEERPAGGPRS